MILNSRTYLNSCHRRLQRNYIKKRLRNKKLKKKNEIWGLFQGTYRNFKWG